MDNTVISALELRILLHFFYSRDPWGGEGGQAAMDGMMRLHRHGLLNVTVNTTKLTPKGDFYVRYILATPFPTEQTQYVIKRD